VKSEHTAEDGGAEGVLWVCIMQQQVNTCASWRAHRHAHSFCSMVASCLVMLYCMQGRIYVTHSIHTRVTQVSLLLTGSTMVHVATTSLWHLTSRLATRVP
jgi:hypothetical protein